jgi:hypothetical protein
MNFGDTEMNDAGGRWAGMVTNEKIWDKVKSKERIDPTVANPKLNLFVISGDLEEYVPGPLDSTGHPLKGAPRTYDVKKAFENYFQRVDVTIEPNVGHYIFNHKDANGHDVVLRSVLKANGESLNQEKELKKAFSERMAQRPNYDLLALRYDKEPFFRAYLDRVAAKEGKSGMDLVQSLRQSQDKKGAQDVLMNFLTVERQRVEALNENIKSSAKWAPEFYKENKAAIDVLDGKGDHTTITAKYLAYLESQPKEVVQQHAQVPESVFVIPEKVRSVAAAGPVTPEIKQGIMRDPDLKAFVISHHSSERNDVVNAIGALKVDHPDLSNEEIMKRVKEQFGGN